MRLRAQSGAGDRTRATRCVTGAARRFDATRAAYNFVHHDKSRRGFLLTVDALVLVTLRRAAQQSQWWTIATLPTGALIAAGTRYGRRRHCRSQSPLSPTERGVVGNGGGGDIAYTAFRSPNSTRGAVLEPAAVEEAANSSPGLQRPRHAATVPAGLAPPLTPRLAPDARPPLAGYRHAGRAWPASMMIGGRNLAGGASAGPRGDFAGGQAAGSAAVSSRGFSPSSRASDSAVLMKRFPLHCAFGAFRRFTGPCHLATAPPRGSPRLGSRPLRGDRRRGDTASALEIPRVPLASSRFADARPLPFLTPRDPATIVPVRCGARAGLHRAAIGSGSGRVVGRLISELEARTSSTILRWSVPLILGTVEADVEMFAEGIRGSDGDDAGPIRTLPTERRTPKFDSSPGPTNSGGE
ncbi:unnamed protein product [Lampetra fluviatilis]